MKLRTKAITKGAQKQYPLSSNMTQKIVAKFFAPWNQWTWYVMNQDPNDPDYLWGIAVGHDVEMGSFSLSALEHVRGPVGLKIERDLYYESETAHECWDRLVKEA